MAREQAYVLTHDVTRFESYEHDYYADLWIKDDPTGGHTHFFDEKPIDIHGPLIYCGYPPIIRTLDFPVTDNSWLVMSGKMLKALKVAGEFRYLEFPVVITDYRHLPENWCDEGGKFREEMVIRGYFAIQLLECLDIFDFERSKYTPDPDYADFIGNVDEYVLKIPDEGLPPIFRIKGEPVKTFISHKARMSLKKSVVTGVKYVSLNGIQCGKGMFVDVRVLMPQEEK